MSVPMKQSDPAYWLLELGLNDPSQRTTTTVYKEGCYICEDPEFSLMGMPLCYPCPHCKSGHVPADDVVCDDCGERADEQPEEDVCDS